MNLKNEENRLVFSKNKNKSIRKIEKAKLNKQISPRKFS